MGKSVSGRKAQSVEQSAGGGGKVRKYAFRLDAEQDERFQAMFEESGMSSLTDFIAHRLFDREFRVHHIDTTRQEFYAKLSEFKRQFVGVATNYNQVVRRIHTNFGEKRARYLLAELDKNTLEMGRAFREILIHIEKFEQSWLSE